MSRVSRSSSFRSCFRQKQRHAPPQPPPKQAISVKPNLATCLYQTDLGLFSLTWSRSFLGHSLDLHHHGGAGDCAASPFSLPTAASFHLQVKPFVFWRRVGSRRLRTRPGLSIVEIYWDLSRAGFGSGPEPESGFYVAVVVDGEMALVVGDLADRAYGRSRARKGAARDRLVLRREHVVGERVYATRARFGGKERQISVNCDGDERLAFAVDGEKVLTVKRLKWKFRGNERVDVDGVAVQISWDVYNWLFDDAADAHAVFMFRFEGCESGHSVGAAAAGSCGFGMNGVEMRKMRRSFMRTSGRSSSSSSLSSSASSTCSSSVMEWASGAEESDQLSGPTGFSLLVYAWKK